MNNIRNVAIIAHVDHGKTTLVDALLRQSQTKLNKDVKDQICIMDSNEIEKERGITIFSKNASVNWEDLKINIIDTPGHADFGGEVERVLTMADGCLLLVDAKEGPMPQTRFVLKKALAMKLKVIVVVNKIDKKEARIRETLNRVFDLFIELGADEETTNFPVVYAAAKKGLAGNEPEIEKMKDISPIFAAIKKYVPAPTGDSSKPLQMLITTLFSDNFKGRVATGRIYNGRITAGQEVMHITREGKQKKFRLTSLMSFFGLERIEAKSAEAGDIVAVAGVPEINIGDTVADPEKPMALPPVAIEEPTVKVVFCVNDSPFSGKEGKFSTSRQLRERIYKELENDVAMRIEPLANSQGKWVVSGRGELHLAIFFERLRREGYEFQVSRPQVIVKEIDGQKMVPFDEVFIEAPEIYAGAIIQKLGSRKGEMREMKTEGNTVNMQFVIPTRGLFGYRNEFLTDTKGLGIMNTIFEGYHKDPGDWKEREQGSLVVHTTGTTNLYGLVNVQGRGVLFMGQAHEVYKGQVVGQHSRGGDLRVNVCKAKQLSNMRSKGEGSDEHFKTPKIMDLEDALEYIGDDELVEITPKNIRIRKMILDENEQKKKDKGILS